MKRLEARFHPPFAATEAYIVVGHLIVDGGEVDTHPRVEVAPSLARHGAPASILATLRYLVATAAPRSLERLESMRWRYWSFVPVGTDTADVQDA